jgi:hypothetical protein
MAKWPWDSDEDTGWHQSFQNWRQWAEDRDPQIVEVLERMKPTDAVVLHELCERAAEEANGKAEIG